MARVAAKKTSPNFRQIYIYNSKILYEGFVVIKIWINRTGQNTNEVKIITLNLE